MVGYLTWADIELFKHKVLASSLSQNTVNTYSSGIRQYLRFCQAYSVSPLPLVEGTLENFCVHMGASVGYRSLKVYLCGVQLWCTMNGFYDKVADMERLHYVLRGIRRLQGNTHIRPPRAPVTVSMLESMYDAAALFPSAHDCALVRSVVTLAFLVFSGSRKFVLLRQVSFPRRGI